MIMAQQGTHRLEVPRGPPEDVAPASEIIPGLFLGGKNDVDNNRWTHILNLWRKELPGHIEFSSRAGTNYLHVPFADLPEEEFRMISELGRILRFLDKAMAQLDVRILIHCRKGISRSATICAAFLMHSGRGGAALSSLSHIPLDATLAFMRIRRPQVQPNLGFMRFLEWYSQNPSIFHEEAKATDAQVAAGGASGFGRPLYPHRQAIVFPQQPAAIANHISYGNEANRLFAGRVLGGGLHVGGIMPGTGQPVPHVSAAAWAPRGAGVQTIHGGFSRGGVGGEIPGSHQVWGSSSQAERPAMMQHGINRQGQI